MSNTARENALQEPDVRPGTRMSGQMARMSGPMIPDRHLDFATRFGAEIDDFGRKIGEISWMESGETWGDARSTRNQANPWIKINKTSSNQQITKKNWGYFWWGFLNLGRNQTKQG